MGPRLGDRKVSFVKGIGSALAFIGVLVVAAVLQTNVPVPHELLL